MKNEEVICTVSLALVKSATFYVLWCLESRFRVPINLSLHFRRRGCLLRVPVKFAGSQFRANPETCLK